MKKYKAAVLTGICFLMLTGCQTAGIQDDGNGGQAAANETTNTVQENEQPIKQGEAAEEPQEISDVSQSVEPEQAAEEETVEYSYDDLYLSIDVPDGWDYKVRSVEELEKEDGLITCAIEFWRQDYPETVFSLEYMTMFGICGTGVTIEEFTLPNGLSGYRYTEEIEDTLWFTITLSNPENMLQGGCYLIQASPDLAVWDTVREEFEEILESIWVGARL